MKKIFTFCLMATLSWGVQAQNFSVKKVYVYDDITTNPPHKVSGDSIILNDTVSFGINLLNNGSQILGPLDTAGFRFSVDGKVIGFFGKVNFGNLVPSIDGDFVLNEKYVFTKVGKVKVCAKIVHTSVGNNSNNDTACKVYTVVPPAGVLLTSFTPNEGYRGSQIVLKGFRFGVTAATNVVKIGTITCTVDTASATRLVVTLPATAVTGKISVTAGGKTSTSRIDYNVRIPLINSFSPDSAFISDTIRLLCSELLDRPTVRFNGAKAGVVIWRGDTVWAAVPAGSTTGKIKFEYPTTSATSAKDFIIRAPKDTTDTSISVTEIAKIEAKIWQNGSTLSISEIVGDYDLKILDLNGKSFLDQSLKMENTNDVIEVDISTLTPGVYIAIMDNAYFKFVKSE
jgi:hypothetical protein